MDFQSFTWSDNVIIFTSQLLLLVLVAAGRRLGQPILCCQVELSARPGLGPDGLGSILGQLQQWAVQDCAMLAGLATVCRQVSGRHRDQVTVGPHMSSSAVAALSDISAMEISRSYVDSAPIKYLVFLIIVLTFKKDIDMHIGTWLWK